jgi:hypothetical protein
MRELFATTWACKNRGTTMSRASPLILAASLVAVLSAGNAWAGEAPVSPPRAAVLRQYLMVAALTCHAVANTGFVIPHRGGSRESPNASSLRNLHDPQYCLVAMTAFLASLNLNRQATRFGAAPTGISRAPAVGTPVGRPVMQRQALLVGR